MPMSKQLFMLGLNLNKNNKSNDLFTSFGATTSVVVATRPHMKHLGVAEFQSLICSTGRGCGNFNVKSAKPRCIVGMACIFQIA